MKAVPPPLSGNYIPLSDPTDLDESQMTYGPKQTHTSDSEPKTSDLDSCKSNSSVESLESMPKPVIDMNPRQWNLPLVVHSPTSKLRFKLPGHLKSPGLIGNIKRYSE
ncbi:hypothetical protein Tco_0567636 [Tanacetum coccineum]